MENKKTNIVIVDYKDTSANRTTFETQDHGKMSAFKNEGETLIQDLKDHANRLISVDVSKSEKEGTTYYNIRKFHGAYDTSETPSPLDTKDKERPLMKAEVIKMSNGMELPMRESPRKPVKGSAYEKDPVGLAVEVFNNLIQSDKIKVLTEDQEESTAMRVSIALVKQAQEAFS